MIKILLILLIAGMLLCGCSIGKYDGLTAEEWADEYYYEFDKYENFRSCVKDYDSFILNYCE